MKDNLLINYGWEWGLANLKNGGLHSSEVSRLDLIVRWGGRRRLNGFLPVQSVYADFYVRMSIGQNLIHNILSRHLAGFKNRIKHSADNASLISFLNLNFFY
jgi:undecaprenyl diphosphate synthase